MSRIGKKVLIAAVVVVIAVVGGPWVYINVIKDDAPEALTLDTVPTTIGAASDTTVVTSASDVDGEWVATSESVVGYRVREILFGQSTEGVGRTNSVTGSLVVSESVVTSASFTVEMATLVSDSDRRDRQVAGRILDVASQQQHDRQTRHHSSRTSNSGLKHCPWSNLRAGRQQLWKARP